jgi:hypothetical protein
MKERESGTAPSVRNTIPDQKRSGEKLKSYLKSISGKCGNQRGVLTQSIFSGNVFEMKMIRHIRNSCGESTPR